MNYQRITISLPDTTYNDVLAIAGKGNVSSFIANATKNMILDKKIKLSSPVDAFIALRNRLPKISDKKIFEAIRKGRM